MIRSQCRPWYGLMIYIYVCLNPYYKMSLQYVLVFERTKRTQKMLERIDPWWSQFKGGFKKVTRGSHNLTTLQMKPNSSCYSLHPSRRSNLVEIWNPNVSYKLNTQAVDERSCMSNNTTHINPMFWLNKISEFFSRLYGWDCEVILYSYLFALLVPKNF